MDIFWDLHLVMYSIKKLEKKLLSKQGATKEFPFGDDVAVFKVQNKMFALYTIKDGIINLNLKVTPEDAIVYRDIYECVIAGYHMNKKHWNTIILNGCIKDEIVEDMIDESYELIVSKLTKKQRDELKALNG